SAVLQLTPDRFWIKGSPYSPRNPESRLRTNNVWVRTSGLASEEPFLDHIAELLADVEPRRRELEQLADKCTINFFLGYSPGDSPGKTTLNHALLRRLASLPLSLTFDLKPPVLAEDGAPDDKS